MKSTFFLASLLLISLLFNVRLWQESNDWSQEAYARNKELWDEGRRADEAEAALRAVLKVSAQETQPEAEVERKEYVPPLPVRPLAVFLYQIGFHKYWWAYWIGIGCGAHGLSFLLRLAREREHRRSGAAGVQKSLT